MTDNYVCLEYPRKSFSLVMKSTPTLKGEIDNCPLGNFKGLLSWYLHLEKPFLGCHYLKN